MHTENPHTAPDLRAEIARSGYPVYIVAARARIHPATLSKVLHGRLPLSENLAQRVLSALREEGVMHVIR